MSFTGFPAAALDFYDDLEMDNTKSWWTAHKDVYEESVRAPMAALLAELEEEFGTAKMFRPYRDVRFAKDKTPYKTHQGAYVAVAPSTGWYVQVSAPGVRVGAGFYDATSDRLARIRTAIDEDRRGKQLEKLLAQLTKAGWTVGGEKLKTTPRGYDADHPRIDLLRHKSLSVGKNYGFEPVIHTAELTEQIRADWRATKPLITWLTDNS
ncbi:DUF2461 domain-containing protein [Kribbella sp. NPDC026611]|uniref:DUF2461 domain-containing protein n=1 Tax=Kribbella sp. NPDC026611 TaxID=3154911 RepID=UPI0033F69A33